MTNARNTSAACCAVRIRTALLDVQLLEVNRRSSWGSHRWLPFNAHIVRGEHLCVTTVQYMLGTHCRPSSPEWKLSTDVDTLATNIRSGVRSGAHLVTGGLPHLKLSIQFVVYLREGSDPRYLWYALTAPGGLGPMRRWRLD